MAQSVDRCTAVRLLQEEAGRAEHLASSAGEVFAPYVLLLADGSRYVRRLPSGALVLEPLTSALTGAVRLTDREHGQARAGAWNKLLSEEQRAAGAAVQPIHERAVYAHVAAAARMLLDRFRVAA